jgi:hypothetical protein
LGFFGLKIYPLANLLKPSALSSSVEKIYSGKRRGGYKIIKMKLSLKNALALTFISI